jgi:GDPmannose 4,6-dehydratase
MRESPYGVTKVFAYWACVNARESYGTHVSNGIMFNHESERRGLEFVTRKITDAVARIAAGKQKELVLGNLDAHRDWGYAPEYVEVMWRMLQREVPDDFVIATGETHSVKKFLELAFTTAGIDDYESYVRTDPKFKRPADVQRLRGDPAKAEKILGWRAKTRLDDLVRIMVEADMKRVAG